MRLVMVRKSMEGDMKLSLRPFSLDNRTWCYEEIGGLHIIHEDRDLKGKFIQTHHIRIPLKKIKGYMKRKGLLCKT